jgi:hypothetical protein
MTKASTLLLQMLVVALGLAALSFLLWMPTVEGVNANATTLSDIYLDDPFLAYAYASSIAFFIGLYHVFKLVGYAGQGQLVSAVSAHALRAVKYCASAFAALVAAPLAYLFVVRPGDDIAGGVAMGLFLIVCSLVTATAAAKGEKNVRKKVQGV